MRSRAARASPTHAEQVRPRVDRPLAVELRELGVGAEAGEQRLEPVELGRGRFERLAGVVGVDEQLDVRAHRAERPPLHHEVLVIVSGGSITTRTPGRGGGRCVRGRRRPRGALLRGRDLRAPCVELRRR